MYVRNSIENICVATLDCLNSGMKKAMINISIMANDSYKRVKSLEFVVEEISIF